MRVRKKIKIKQLWKHLADLLPFHCIVHQQIRSSIPIFTTLMYISDYWRFVVCKAQDFKCKEDHS